MLRNLEHANPVQFSCSFTAALLGLPGQGDGGIPGDYREGFLRDSLGIPHDRMGIASSALEDAQEPATCKPCSVQFSCSFNICYQETQSMQTLFSSLKCVTVVKNTRSETCNMQTLFSSVQFSCSFNICNQETQSMQTLFSCSKCVTVVKKQAL